MSAPGVLVFVLWDEIKDLKRAYADLVTDALDIAKVGTTTAKASPQHLDIGATLGLQRAIVHVYYDFWAYSMNTTVGTPPGQTAPPGFGGTLAPPAEMIAASEATLYSTYTSHSLRKTFEGLSGELLPKFWFVNVGYKGELVQPKHTWTFANATARQASGTYTTNDIGKIAYQTDTEEFWELTGYTTSGLSQIPEWAPSSVKRTEIAASVLTDRPTLFFFPFGDNEGIHTEGLFTFYASMPDPAQGDSRYHFLGGRQAVIVKIPTMPGSIAATAGVYVEEGGIIDWLSQRLEPYTWIDPSSAGSHVTPGTQGFDKSTTGILGWVIEWPRVVGGGLDPLYDPEDYPSVGGNILTATEEDVGRLLYLRFQEVNPSGPHLLRTVLPRNAGEVHGIGNYVPNGAHYVLRNHDPITWEFWSGAENTATIDPQIVRRTGSHSDQTVYYPTYPDPVITTSGFTYALGFWGTDPPGSPGNPMLSAVLRTTNYELHKVRVGVEFLTTPTPL